MFNIHRKKTSAVDSTIDGPSLQTSSTPQLTVEYSTPASEHPPFSLPIPSQSFQQLQQIYNQQQQQQQQQQHPQQTLSQTSSVSQPQTGQLLQTISQQQYNKGTNQRLPPQTKSKYSPQEYSTTQQIAFQNSNRNNKKPLSSPDMRRVWVKRPAHTATTIMTGQNDIIDDLKYMITTKFPTSLALECDPSDLVIKLEIPSSTLIPTQESSPKYNASSSAYKDGIILASNNKIKSASPSLMESSSPLLYPAIMKSSISANESKSTTPLCPLPVFHSKSSLLAENDWATTDMQPTPTLKYIVLEPDNLIWDILDKYFPDGMKISDALIIDIVKSPTNDSFKITHQNQQQNQPLFQYSARNTNLDHTNYDGKSPTSNPHESKYSNSSRTAVLGIQKLPPPRENMRLRSTGSVDPQPTPLSSAVILFPKEARSESKSPTPNLGTAPPPPSPKTATSEDNEFKMNRRRPLIPSKSNLSDTRVHSNPRLAINTSSEDKSNKPNKEDLLSSSNLTPVSANDERGRKLKKHSKNNKDKLGISKILSHINVLVVEDNLVNQKIMARHLKSCNVKFQIASTGKEALEMWKRGGFHLCFMDIQLPVMSGIEVTKEIRRLERLNRIGNFATTVPKDHLEETDESDSLALNLFKSPIIIVALTASTGATDQQNALAAGCNDYLTKPVQLKWLKSKLTEWGCMQALINYDYFRNES